MKITRDCMLTGQTNVMDLDVTTEQIKQWQQGELIQNVMPHLSIDEREFLITGMLPDTWDNIFNEAE